MLNWTPKIRFGFMEHLYRYLFTPVPLIGLIHLLGGMAILHSPNAVNVSGLSGLVLFTGLNSNQTASVLILVGGAALASRLLIGISDVFRDVLVLPQQGVLAVQFGGILVALINGAYPDGYVPVPGSWGDSFWFILSDQSALIMLCLSHTLDLCFARTINLTHMQYQKKLDDKECELNATRQELANFHETAFWLKLTEDISKPEKQDQING